jgi:hypothetical protein
MEILNMRFGGVEVGTLLAIAAACWIAYRIKRWWGLKSSIRYVNEQIAHIDHLLESSPGDVGLHHDRAKFCKLLDGLNTQLNN